VLKFKRKFWRQRVNKEALFSKYYASTNKMHTPILIMYLKRIQRVKKSEEREGGR
jgi:hypothetical protein